MHAQEVTQEVLAPQEHASGKKKLKPDLRKLRKQPFKNKIHQFLLAVLGNEDDYVDVPTLMLKISNYH